MRTPLFYRTSRCAVVMLIALAAIVANIGSAPPASASVKNNCGYVTCTIYLDKQSTRSLDNLFNNNEVGVTSSIAVGLACETLGGYSVACDIISAAGAYYVKTILDDAVHNDACLTVKYGVGLNAGGITPTAALGWSTNTSYCAAGTPLFSNGTLVKQASLPQVWVVYGGAKFLILNPQSFTSLGFSWSAIQTISDKDFHNVPPLPAYGTILREQTLPTVYRIENGRKRAVSLDEYLRNGYGPQLHYVPDGDLVQIPTK